MQPRVIYLLVKTMLQKRIFKKMLVFRRKSIPLQANKNKKIIKRSQKCGTDIKPRHCK